MSIIVTLEVDDKGSATMKSFSDSANKNLSSVSKSSNMLTKNMSDGFNRVGDSLYKATTYVAKFALEFATGALVAGATGLALLTKTAADFEQKMDFLGAVVNTNDTEMKMLNDTVLQLGTTTSFTSTQVADAATMLGQAGFTANEIVSALPGTLALATAGTVDLTTASDIAASTLRSFGFETGEMSKVADVLTQTALSTATTVQSIGEGMKYVAPLARLAGLSFQEVSAAIGLLGNVGIQGSMAGTTLRAAISALLNPTKEESALLQQLGISVADSSGKIYSLTEVIRQMQVAGVTTGEVMEIFGLRGGPGMAALLSMGSDALKNMTVELENAGGTADRVAQEKLNNLSGQLGIAKSSFEAFAIAFASPMLPMFTDFIKTQLIPTILNMTIWIKNNEDSIKSFAESLVSFFMLAGTALQEFLVFAQSYLLPALASVFQTIGSGFAFAGSMLSTALEGLEYYVNTITKIIGTLLTAGLGRFIPGLVSVSDALKNTNLNFDEFQNSITNFGSKSMQLGDSMADITMKTGDMLYSFNTAVTTMEKTSATTKKVETDTSTLAKTINGQLTPSLIDAEYEYSKAIEVQRLMGDSEIGLADITAQTTKNMSSNVGELSNQWDSVGDSISGANDNLSNFSSKTAGLGAGGADGGSYEMQVKTEDLNKFYSSLNELYRKSGASMYATVAGSAFSSMQFADGGIVPGNPNQSIPAIVHGGETIIPAGSSIVVQLVLNDKVLAEQMIDLSDRNVSGLGNKFTPKKRNIKNYQEMGA